MSLPSLLDSAYWRWCQSQPQAPEKDAETRAEALKVLVADVASGNYHYLDGFDSPNSREIRRYHGTDVVETNQNWLGSSQHWVCPCCRRSKFQISRFGRQRQILMKLVVHHDHAKQMLELAFNKAFEKYGIAEPQQDGKRLVERMGPAFAAHDDVLICEDCNVADGKAKAYLNLHKCFSFTVGQIREFIEVVEHQPHEVDHARAAEVWEDAAPGFALRKRLVWEVAKAAVRDNHWYEPFARGADPVPTFGVSRLYEYRLAAQWCLTDDLFAALGPPRRTPTSNWSRWRTEHKPPGKSLPTHWLAMLRSSDVHARRWNEIADDWQCSVCRRAKAEVVYVNQDGRVTFLIRHVRRCDNWQDAPSICNHCESVVRSLGREVAGHGAYTEETPYSLFTPAQVASIIEPRPHSSHRIRQVPAAELVALAIDRSTLDDDQVEGA